MSENDYSEIRVNSKWRLERLLELYASGKEIVLILGESGTGKEIAARRIHYLSKRKGKYIPINCTAMTESLIESELFGHDKGAFTDAKIYRKGAFEAAVNGTVFLDEIGDMPLSTQTKLLRALQDGYVLGKKTGSDEEKEFETRVVCATNANLQTLISKGLFREDLYYRISRLKVNLIPLRERSKVEKLILIKEKLQDLNKNDNRKKILTEKLIDLRKKRKEGLNSSGQLADYKENFDEEDEVIENTNDSEKYINVNNNDITKKSNNELEFERRLDNIKTIDIEEGALNILFNYSWPGNVRQLHNIISDSWCKAALLNKNINSDIVNESLMHEPGKVNDDNKIDKNEKLMNLTVDDLARHLILNNDSINLPQVLDDFERALLANAFQKGGIQARAAELLEISSASFWIKSQDLLDIPKRKRKNKNDKGKPVS